MIIECINEHEMNRKTIPVGRTQRVQRWLGEKRIKSGNWREYTKGQITHEEAEMIVHQEGQTDKQSVNVNIENVTVVKDEKKKAKKPSKAASK